MTKWVLNLFVTVLVTMIMIYTIKKLSKQYEIPFLKTVAEEV
jgi:hypothetical protein